MLPAVGSAITWGCLGRRSGCSSNAVIYSEGATVGNCQLTMLFTTDQHVFFLKEYLSSGTPWPPLSVPLMEQLVNGFHATDPICNHIPAPTTTLIPVQGDQWQGWLTSKHVIYSIIHYLTHDGYLLPGGHYLWYKIFILYTHSHISIHNSISNFLVYNLSVFFLLGFWPTSQIIHHCPDFPCHCLSSPPFSVARVYQASIFGLYPHTTPTNP